MPAKARAVVRGGVYFCEASGQVAAPFGEYEVCRTCDGLVSFCRCGDDRCFTLSFDALMQHVAEGRISMPSGPIPRAD